MQTAWKSDSYFWIYCDFIFFKMAAGGGRRFEINNKSENYKTQTISQKHAYTDTHLKMQSLLCKYSFYDVILWILYFYYALLERKNQYRLWASDFTTSLIFWFPAWHF